MVTVTDKTETIKEGVSYVSGSLKLNEWNNSYAIYQYLDNSGGGNATIKKVYYELDPNEHDTVQDITLRTVLSEKNVT